MRVIKKTETLQDYVQRHMREQDLTLRDVESRSRRGGAVGISRPTVNKIANGVVFNLSLDKLRALARGISRPEEEIFDIVLGTSAAQKEFEKRLLYAVADAEHWTPDQQNRFMDIVGLAASGIRSERQNMIVAPDALPMASHSKKTMPISRPPIVAAIDSPLTAKDEVRRLYEDANDFNKTSTPKRKVK